MSAIVGDGSPLTANGVVDGTQLGEYTLPLLGQFRVESVVAQIDASGAPAVTPTLRVKDKSGAVIATKRQSSTIPAGQTGSATWALRLADDGGGGITQIVSGNGSVTVINPFGPVVDLRVAAAGGAADARHYGYLTFQVFRPGVPFDRIVADVFDTIVGTKANGVTIGNLYTVQFTVTVNAGDYLSLFYQNQSGAVRNVQMNNGRVQDAGGNIEDVTAGSAPQNVANNNGIALDFAHGSGTSSPPPNAVLLNYATPTKPFFIAGGTYNVQMLFYASFWV